MEDLIGLIAIIVFAVINMLAQGAKKKQMRRSESPDGEETVPQKAPSSLEEFLGRLAEKLEPKETELPAWPEDRAKPDYLAEMKVFEAARPAPPPPIPEPMMLETELPEIALPSQNVSLRRAMKSVPSELVHSMRMPLTPMLRSSAGAGTGQTVSLRKKSDLKKAIIAQIIFSAPRAYDTTFDNTVL